MPFNSKYTFFLIEGHREYTFKRLKIWKVWLPIFTDRKSTINVIIRTHSWHRSSGCMAQEERTKGDSPLRRSGAVAALCWSKRDTSGPR